MIQLKDDFSFCQMNFKSYSSGEKIQSYQTRLSFLSPGILLLFLDVKLSGTCQDSITHFPNPDISNEGSDFVTNSYSSVWWVKLGLILFKIMSPSSEPLSPSTKQNESLGLL